MFHFRAAFVPESNLVGLLKSNSGCFLQGRHATIANTSVRTGNVFDKMLGSNKVSHTPTGGIKGFAGRSHSQSTLVKLRGQGANPSEWDIKEAVVDFVGENDKIVLDTKLTNTFQLSTRENLPNRVVAVAWSER